MAEPGSTDREALDRVVTLLGPRLDEASLAARRRHLALARRRAARGGGDASAALQDLARELGLVTREDWDELELRVAQLEHRLRLLEDAPTDRP